MLTMPLSVKQASEIVNVPKRTVLYAITSGNLKANKMPGRTGAWLIDPTDLEDWVARRAGE